jgi:hypothetical protein
LLDAKTLPWIFILFYFLNKLKIGAHRESVCEREREREQLQVRRRKRE